MKETKGNNMEILSEQVVKLKNTYKVTQIKNSSSNFAYIVELLKNGQYVFITSSAYFANRSNMKHALYNYLQIK